MLSSLLDADLDPLVRFGHDRKPAKIGRCNSGLCKRTADAVVVRRRFLGGMGGYLFPLRAIILKKTNLKVRRIVAVPVLEFVKPPLVIADGRIRLGKAGGLATAIAPPDTEPTVLVLFAEAMLL